MKTDESLQEDDATCEFERALNRLIADSFARGAAIENTWEITTPVTDAPNWAVNIERTYADDAPSYDPDLLEE